MKDFTNCFAGFSYLQKSVVNALEAWTIFALNVNLEMKWVSVKKARNGQQSGTSVFSMRSRSRFSFLLTVLPPIELNDLHSAQYVLNMAHFNLQPSSAGKLTEGLTVFALKGGK